MTGIALSSVGGEKIAGDFTLAKDAGGALTGVLTPSSDASSRIDYVFEEPISLTSDGKTLLFVIPAGNYSKGFKVVVSDNAGKSMTLHFFVSGALLPAARVFDFQDIAYSAGSELGAIEAEGGLPDLPSESGQNMVSIKAGTYNIWSPEARKTVMDADPEVSEQRSWANSYEAVAAMINYLDCDVMGLQEVSSRAFRTTLTGPKEDYDGNIHTLHFFRTAMGPFQKQNVSAAEIHFVIPSGVFTSAHALHPDFFLAALESGKNPVDLRIVLFLVFSQIAFQAFSAVFLINTQPGICFRFGRIGVGLLLPQFRKNRLHFRTVRLFLQKTFETFRAEMETRSASLYSGIRRG